MPRGEMGVIVNHTNGFRLFLQQCKALFVKNFTLARRNLVATLLQLCASFFFIFLIWAINQAIQTTLNDDSSYKNLFTPDVLNVDQIPRCEDTFFTKPKPCWDFVYSPNNDPQIEQIVDGIRRNNGNRPITKDKTKGFASVAAANQWLLENKQRTKLGIHFIKEGPSRIAFGIQTNGTTTNKRGRFEEVNFKLQIPMQTAAEREIARILLNNQTLAWNAKIAEYAHPAISTFSAVGSIGPTMLFAASMFGFVLQMTNLVMEKENRLRQAMATMGMMDSAYWTTWLLWEIGLSSITAILTVIFGLIFQFDFFLNNDFGILFFVFFLFSVNMTGFSFMLSAFLRKAANAINLGFFIFIIGFVTQLVTAFGFPYDISISNKKTAEVIWAFFPPNLLAKALGDLGKATATSQDPGVKWKNRNKCAYGNEECGLTVGGIYNWWVATFFLWFVLALYFDNIVPDVNGVRKGCFYFLSPGFWTGRGAGGSEAGCCTREAAALPDEPIGGDDPDDPDVAAEKSLVQQQVGEVLPETVAVQVRGLQKVFPGNLDIKPTLCCVVTILSIILFPLAPFIVLIAFFTCCKRKQQFVAVRGSYFNMEKGKLFCLLGPNGAGKTTTINCLTGIIPTTAGDGIVYGNSIRRPTEMGAVRRYMGVCPQFDILWDALTGREHLLLFANIKGLPPHEIHEEVERLLEDVQLSSSATMRSGSYSGGMKRRLSVAVALIGDPKIVYLDEPTTGMDPVSRRHVWDIIERAKKGRAIVLTTHSMEEADILGDRIAIMARGRLRCLGTSIHLKNRFGTGYMVSCNVRTGTGTGGAQGGQGAAETERRLQGVKQFFKEKLDVEATDESKSFVRFLVPRSREQGLPLFFADLRDNKANLGITDVQLSLTTLEEVFLNIARQAELKTALSENRFEEIELEDGQKLKVPVGAEAVLVPNSASPEAPNGLVIKISWQQDENGALRIGHHDAPIPMPVETQVEEAGNPTQRNSFDIGRAVSFTRRGQ